MILQKTRIKSFIHAERIQLKQESKTYARLAEDAAWFYKQILAALPENGDSRSQLLKLADTYSSMETEAMDRLYRRGFSDGIKIMVQGLIRV